MAAGLAPLVSLPRNHSFKPWLFDHRTTLPETVFERPTASAIQEGGHRHGVEPFRMVDAIDALATVPTVRMEPHSHSGGLVTNHGGSGGSTAVNSDAQDVHVGYPGQGPAV